MIIKYCFFFYFLFQDLNQILWHLEVPKVMYNLLLGLYIPIIISGAILNLTILMIILSTKKLRKDPR